jgi:2-polyprenyl-6-methoxyphenol hydroxylase-like FAD-dependent oxidoreductase
MIGAGLRVLVVGAGIGGLGAARALRRRGFAADVIEREPAWTHTGAGIYLPGNASRALHALGLESALAERASPISHQRLCDHRARLLADIDLAALWDDVGPCLALHRADGIHSTVRQLTVGADAVRPVGQVAWRFVTECPPEVTTWTVLLGRGITFLEAEGAAMAFEDGLVLAECLASGRGIAQTVATFEARRRPRAQWVLAQTHHRDRTRNLRAKRSVAGTTRLGGCARANERPPPSRLRKTPPRSGAHVHHTAEDHMLGS